MPEPEETVKLFVIGSKIKDIDRQIGDWKPSQSETGGSFANVGHSGKPMVETKLGEFPEAFDGVIRLYHHSWVIPDDIRPSFMIELTYDSGKLIEANYGVLPG